MATKNIKFKDISVEYKEKGTGKLLVFLHGYMETLNIWDKVQNVLSKEFKVITIDLPGHGNSGVSSEIHTMDFMADAVDAVVEDAGENKLSIIGHSMGGYVALEYMSKYPQKVEKYCLFHSTPFEDTEEKKQDRDRIIDLIKQGKKIQIAKQHSVKTFATKNIEKLQEEIGFFKIMAVNTPDEGVIACLKGMRSRKNHYNTMQETKSKGLWILGKLDNFIDYKKIEKVEIPKNCEVFTLNESGHQGYIEEEEKVLEKLKSFLNS